MKISIASVSAKGALSGPCAQLLSLYTERAARYTPTVHQSFGSEAKLLASLEGASTRTKPYLLLADSTGKLFSSTELSAQLSQLFDNGIQTLLLAIGPADGWSPAALARADKVIAFGRITLPHELAAVVAAEQLYRALTIRAGHPYHTGH